MTACRPSKHFQIITGTIPFMTCKCTHTHTLMSRPLFPFCVGPGNLPPSPSPSQKGKSGTPDQTQKGKSSLAMRDTHTHTHNDAWLFVNLHYLLTRYVGYTCRHWLPSHPYQNEWAPHYWESSVIRFSNCWTQWVVNFFADRSIAMQRSISLQPITATGEHVCMNGFWGSS